MFTVISTLSGAHYLSAQNIIQGSDGNLYVSCTGGGATDNGSIVKLSTTGELLSYYLFPGGAGGSEPVGLVQASDGNYYGATLFGGVPGSGDGTIFRMTPQMEVTILYTFDPRRGSHDGTLPGYPIQATDGSLYGVTFGGGLYGCGTIFRISLQGDYSQVYSFPLSVGNEPQFIMQDPSGVFYGSANLGSKDNYGSIFSLDMGLGPFITFVRSSGKVGQSTQI